MRIIVGMSGGVDSSVSALLLKKKGYDVVGVMFKMLPNFDCSDALSVCEKIGIEFHVMDIAESFKHDVIDMFVSDYKNGLTPNPCVICNSSIKFKYLFEAMNLYNADFVATGHYAKIFDGKLFKSYDANKDQTYFLSSLNKDLFSKILFPLEGISKDMVRSIALENGFLNALKKDSYDVCFINDGFKNFISKNVSCCSGDIIDVHSNKVVGRHNGLMYYTIGQRKGLNIGGNDSRLFVVGKDISKNILYVAFDTDYLISDSAVIENVNWISDNKPLHCVAKFRFRQADNDVYLDYVNDNKIIVKYSQGVKSVTPGQYCVFYFNDECLGGGVIKEVRKNDKKLWYL